MNTKLTWLTLKTQMKKEEWMGECRMQNRFRGAGSVRLWLLGFIILHSSFCLPAWGQSYSIDWHKVSGGGGTSTGGGYSVSATIGQPDASGAMTGGNYSVTGGFWSLIAVVQTTGAPTLTVTHSGKSVIVSWPSPSTGFVLQQNSGVHNASGWQTCGSAITDNGTTRSITLTSPTGTLFFRLAN